MQSLNVPGSDQVIEGCIQKLGANGILCLTGVGHGGHMTKAGTADMAASAVLRNTVIVGSVNANKRQWFRAGQTLAKADRAWLAKAHHPAGKARELYECTRKKAG